MEGVHRQLHHPLKKGGIAIISSLGLRCNGLDLVAMHKKAKYGRPEIFQAVKPTYRVCEVRTSPIIIAPWNMVKKIPIMTLKVILE